MNTKEKYRRRLLKVLSRSQLDSIAGTDKRPWDMLRSDLEAHLVSDICWQEEKVREAIEKLIAKAR